jgi:RimJ/RimL family protein N-acetyltransferase
VPFDADDVRDKARYAAPEGREDFCIWAQDGLAGAADLVPQGPGRGEIIYWIDRDHRGKGYAREAVRAVTAHAFKDRGFHTVRAWVKQTNVPSRKTLERDGFVHTDTNSATGSLGYTLSKPA